MKKPDGCSFIGTNSNLESPGDSVCCLISEIRESDYPASAFAFFFDYQRA